MVAYVSSRPLSLVAAVGTACHAEGRGFESLHPLFASPPQIRGFRRSRDNVPSSEGRKGRF